MKRYLAVMLAASGLCGCSYLMSQKEAQLAPSRTSAKEGEIVTLPAQLRTITTKANPGSYITCAEPGPDVALSDTFKLIAGLTYERPSVLTGLEGASSVAAAKGALSSDLQTSSSAMELAGRTQTVLLAREFLFRTCEAASNGWLTPTAVAESQRKIITAITELVATDKDKAAAAAALAFGKLSPEALATAGKAAVEVQTERCADIAVQCISKAGDNATARDSCKAELAKCLKE